MLQFELPSNSSFKNPTLCLKFVKRYAKYYILKYNRENPQKFVDLNQYIKGFIPTSVAPLRFLLNVISSLRISDRKTIIVNPNMSSSEKSLLNFIENGNLTFKGTYLLTKSINYALSQL